MSPGPKPLLLGLLPCGQASGVQLSSRFSVSTPRAEGGFFLWQGLGPSAFHVLDPA